MKNTKRLCSVLMASVLLSLMFVPFLSSAADEPDYLYSYTFSDIQAEKTDELQTYGGNSNKITTVKDDWGGQDLAYKDTSRGIYNKNLIYLAKNEREGFQVYFFEKGAGRNLRLEVSDFVNENGEVLPHEVFKEEFFTPLNTDKLHNPDGSPLHVADALVPYESGTTVATTQNEAEMFYIEVRSSKEQTAGVYTADVVLYDGDTPLVPTKKTTKVAAVVWDFTLPQQHYGNMIVGLYNSASGYGDSCYFLRQNGISINGQGNVTDPTQQEAADAIIEGWNEYLLDHGISPYEIPRNLIDTDPKAAELAMADVRQKAFFVPFLSADISNGSFGSTTLARMNQYKSLVGDNDYIMSKAHLYLADEPALGKDGQINQGVVDDVTARINAAKSAWPELDRVIAYALSESDLPLATAITLVNPTENTFCLNNSRLDNNKAAVDLYQSNFKNKWRYHGDIQSGSVELWYWMKSTVGSLRRIFFWQQNALQDDMFLYWQAAYYVGHNVWAEHTLPHSGGIQTGNGNGILLYPGTAIGQPAETPIGSLRIKQIASGIDDADYLALAQEFLGQEGYETALRRFLPNALTDDYEKIFTWRNQSVGVWDMWPVNSARIALGNELEAAMGEHEFGDWEEVVEPDETHNGLAIRTCANCGTQESKKTGLCDLGIHLFTTFEPVDADTHDAICEICGVHESQAHTPKTITGTAASCTADGTTDSVVCEICGAVLTAADVIPGGHQFGEWIQGSTATCIAAGVAGHYHCGVCNKDFDADQNELATVDIPKDASNHVGTINLVGQKAASCEAAGYTGDRVCSACTQTVEKGTAIPASGHNWNGGVVTKNATCTENGVKQFTCSNCNQTKTESIQKLGHTQPDGDGKCSRCGAQLEEKCKLCGKIHTGFFGSIVGFFHSIFYYIKNLFK